ncbi:uncharacterized protein [Miscanthus floridulus]|uniref:uncharacterized protein n=1 Tax=Miscanthus floridulus TaxID=154761 RepID=UPI00345AE31B
MEEEEEDNEEEEDEDEEDKDDDDDNGGDNNSGRTNNGGSGYNSSGDDNGGVGDNGGSGDNGDEAAPPAKRHKKECGSSSTKDLFEMLPSLLAVERPMRPQGVDLGSRGGSTHLAAQGPPTNGATSAREGGGQEHLEPDDTGR